MGKLIEFPLHRRMRGKVVRHTDLVVLNVYLGDILVASKELHSGKSIKYNPELEEIAKPQIKKYIMRRVKEQN